MNITLTTEQTDGFRFEAKLRNARSHGGRTNWTSSEVATEFLQNRGAECYRLLLDHKWATTRTAFEALTPEQQATYTAQFGVSDVLGDADL